MAKLQGCRIVVFLLFAATAIAASAQTFTTLAAFDGTDGCVPDASLVQGTDGNLYGTTGGCGASDDGTVFKITPTGTLTTLHSFDGNDGNYPNGLVLGTDGNFYGTTEEGGNPACYDGCGTVFKITPAGTLTTLYSFSSVLGIDGAYPVGKLCKAPTEPSMEEPRPEMARFSRSLRLVR
jgi:uncharacterized repeat protein (TIGR03803 family)